MIKKLIFLIYCCYSLSILSQNPKKIKIPEGKNKIVFYDYDKFFNLYLTKSGKLFFKEKKIKLENLADSIISLKSNLKTQEFSTITPILYIEKNTKYKLVEKIKEEISRAWVFRIIYKTYNKDFFSGFNRPLHLSSKYVERKVILKNDGDYEIILNKNSFEGLAWEGEMEFSLYNEKYKDFFKILKNKKYQKIKIIDKNYFEVGGKKIYFNNSNFTQAIEHNDLIFLSYDKNLKYDDYLYFLSTLNDKQNTYLFVQNIFKVKGKKYLPFIEISTGLKKALKMNRIKF